jgi:prevent-host-death family protein
MKYSESIKPISHLKSHAAEIIRNLSETHQTIIITQNGEAKAIVQDIRAYEELQESLALLKILAQSTSDLLKENFKPAETAFLEIEDYITKLK